MTDDDLELRVAWQRHLGVSPTATDWFESILDRHRSAGRYYHDTRHITWVVRHVATMATYTDDLDAVVAAGFFHDVVYEAARSDNEAASGRLAALAVTEFGWDAARRDHVMAMIEATATHDVDAADADTQVLLAADLAVLATEPARYADYVRAVRREYAHVSDADWLVGRSAVLRGLLERPHLYAPRLERHGWEDRARANMAAEMATLR